MTYETERLYFRPWTIEDAEECFALSSDEHVGPPCGWLPHKALEETKAILREKLINDYTFCIIEKATGKIVGNIGIDELHDPELLERLREEVAVEDSINPGEVSGLPEKELGFWIGYPYWNKGYMTEAVKGTMEYCFNTLGLTRLWCGNYIDNPASGRVQEKCGFEYQYTRKTFNQQLNKEVELLQRSIDKTKWLELK